MKRIALFFLFASALGNIFADTVKQSAIAAQSSPSDTDTLVGWRAQTGVNPPFNYQLPALKTYFTAGLQPLLTSSSVVTVGTLNTTSPIAATSIDPALPRASDVAAAVAAEATARATAIATAQLATKTATSTAYVESTGNDSTAVLNNPSLPYATIQGALSANTAVTSLTIRIGAGAFLSPPGDYTGSTSYMRSNVVFRGAGRPDFNNGGVASTALTGGTILQGPFEISGRNNIQVIDLGIDCGSAVCTALFSGVSQNAFFAFNKGQVQGAPPMTGLVLENVATLCANQTDQIHSCCIENVLRAKIHHVACYYGYHGIVLKAIDSVVSDCSSYNHLSNGMIIKSDIYAPCYNNVISNITVSTDQTGTGRYGIGLILQTVAFPMYGISVKNFVVNNCQQGINTVQGSNTLYPIKNCTIDAIINTCKGGAATVGGDGLNVTIIADTCGDGIMSSTDNLNLVLNNCYVRGSLNNIAVSQAGNMWINNITGSGANHTFYQTGGTMIVSNPTILTGSNTTTFGSVAVVGEIVTSSVPAGSAVALTTATGATVTSISLTAGNWDVTGSVAFTVGATTTVGYLAGAINTVAATLPTTGSQTFIIPGAGTNAVIDTTFAPQGEVPRTPISITSTTTVYLVAQAKFATSTCAAYGALTARRVR